jgi:hypothetical protein
MTRDKAFKCKMSLTWKVTITGRRSRRPVSGPERWMGALKLSHPGYDLSDAERHGSTYPKRAPHRHMIRSRQRLRLFLFRHDALVRPASVTATPRL